MAIDHETRRQQVIFLAGEMDRYHDKAVILMGDMNFPDPDPYFGLHSLLYEAGWCHPLCGQHHIDHLWTTPLLAPHVQPLVKLDYEQSNDVSDHPPVAHDIKVYYPEMKNELHPSLNLLLQRLENNYLFFKEYVDRLSWTVNPANNSNNLKYNLYRKKKGDTDCKYEFMAEVDPYALHYDFRGLNKDSLYTYMITSVDDNYRESKPAIIGD